MASPPDGFFRYSGEVARCSPDCHVGKCPFLHSSFGHGHPHVQVTVAHVSNRAVQVWREKWARGVPLCTHVSSGQVAIYRCRQFL